jgi:uncharacterized RDD family membrane protein YckC
MDNAYYVLEDGDQRGPYTFDELTQLELDIHTRVLSPLADSWQDACDLPELFPYFEALGVHFPTEDNLASFWWRLLAFIIDFILLSFVVDAAISMLIYRGIIPNITDFTSVQSFSKLSASDFLILEATVYGIFISYNTICEASALNGSVGKKICKIVVVDQDGVGLTFPNALFRSFGKAVSMFLYGIPALSILWSEHRQALHDYLARTYVVKL